MPPQRGVADRADLLEVDDDAIDLGLASAHRGERLAHIQGQRFGFSRVLGHDPETFVCLALSCQSPAGTIAIE